MSRRRNLRATVRSQSFSLPKALTFLKAASFVALVEDRSEDKSKWFVEVTTSAFKKLLAAKKPEEAAIAEVLALKKKISCLETELNAARHEKHVLLRQHNNFVDQVVNENGTFRAVPKSTKSLLIAALEQSTNFGSPPLPGGLGGVEKK